MIDELVIGRTLRVPAVADGVAGEPDEDSAKVARQMDAVLVRTGFKASGPLLAHVSALEPGVAMDRALSVIAAVRKLVGDDVAHNVYFKDFPRNVPDTIDFWLESLRQTLALRVGSEGGAPTDAELLDFVGGPSFNLLALHNYGTYQHTYAEMLAAHKELIPSLGDRVTVLHLGDTVEQEAAALYRSLAGSSTPLGEADLPVLEMLASMCLDVDQPESIPVRENRAVVNAVRLAAGRELVGVDTVTDVLRLACQVSDGDVGLQTPTRFRVFSRPERRVLMRALDEVVSANPAKLGDVRRFAGRWVRLAERIHPGEQTFDRYPHAQDVFAVARGDKTAVSLAGGVELAFANGDHALALRRLSAAPGMLMRSLDRLLRTAPDENAVESVLDAVGRVAGEVSGRVLLSLREHLDNRSTSDLRRVFANRGRRAWVTDDERPTLDPSVVQRVGDALDDELARRLPKDTTLVVTRDALGVALPLSGKSTEDGFGVLPRGSVTALDGKSLRFFTYWKEREERTDFDLSTLFLDEAFRLIGQVSYTNYRFEGVTHSGDLTSAPNGATEFVDVPLAGAPKFIIPQVNVYSGEGFDQVAESMFGYMMRDPAAEGAPFEPSTVRTRSAMRGTGRVALPVAFRRLGDGSWQAKWLHLYLAGWPSFNQVEGNHRSTTLLARSVLERRNLTVEYLAGLWGRRAGSLVVDGPDLRVGDEQVVLEGPVTYVGLTPPERALPEGSTVVTPAGLNELIPR